MRTELKTEDYVYLTHYGDNLSLHKVNHKFPAHQRLEHIGFVVDSVAAVNTLYQAALKNNRNILGSVDNWYTDCTRPTFRGLSTESKDPVDKPRGVGSEVNCQQTLDVPKTFGMGTHSFSVQDPDGIEVEFIYHPPMREIPVES